MLKKIFALIFIPLMLDACHPGLRMSGSAFSSSASAAPMVRRLARRPSAIQIPGETSASASTAPAALCEESPKLKVTYKYRLIPAQALADWASVRPREKFRYLQNCEYRQKLDEKEAKEWHEKYAEKSSEIEAMLARGRQEQQEYQDNAKERQISALHNKRKADALRAELSVKPFVPEGGVSGEQKREMYEKLSVWQSLVEAKERQCIRPEINKLEGWNSSSGFELVDGAGVRVCACEPCSERRS